MSKRCILYARVSGADSQNVTSSIGAQLAECRKYADSRGYTIISEVCEDPEKHTSGADWLPELDKLLRLAHSHTFDILVVREVDRLARNRFKQLSTEIELESHGVVVEYAVGQYENSDEGRLLKGLVSEFAEYERGKIRRRTQDGITRAVVAGNVTTGGSVAPYGYDVVINGGKRSFCLNAFEAEIVRLIFDLYAIKGYSLHGIRDYLDDAKIPKPCKGQNHKKMNRLESWSLGTLNGIIANETYIGHWYYRKTKTIKDIRTNKRVVVARAREDWLEVPVPAIISDELFASAQDRREANKRQMGHQRKHEYLLGGMLKCGLCGNSMCGITRVLKDRGYATYLCNSRREPKKFGFKCTNAPFKTAEVDAIVWFWIKSLLLEPATLRQAIEEYQEQQRGRIQPKLSMLESSQTRLSELEGRKARLIEAYTKGILTLDDLAKEKTYLDKEIGEIGRAVSMLREETEPQLLTAGHVESIEAIAAEIRNGSSLVNDDKQAQRAIFRLLNVQVILHGDEKPWADVECVLGSNKYAVEYNTSYDRLTYCIIRTRLWL